MSRVNYDEIALAYAEKYDIILYKVKGRYMIYNQNYYNSEFIGKCIRKSCTYQRTVTLDTMEVTSWQLQRMNKDGWNNV